MISGAETPFRAYGLEPIASVAPAHSCFRSKSVGPLEPALHSSVPLATPRCVVAIVASPRAPAGPRRLGAASRVVTMAPLASLAWCSLPAVVLVIAKALDTWLTTTMGFGIFVCACVLSSFVAVVYALAPSPQTSPPHDPQPATIMHDYYPTEFALAARGRYWANLPETRSLLLLPVLPTDPMKPRMT